MKKSSLTLLPLVALALMPGLASLTPGQGQARANLDITTRQPAKGDEVIVLETSLGQIVVMMAPTIAPNHSANFRDLAGKGFYDGTRFHRCIPGFMIQGGDPNTKDLDKASAWGTGGSDKRINAEFNEATHKRGVLSMARSSNPNSASSQFFIVTSDSTFLDRQYSVFGSVVKGMDVADQIVKTGNRDNNGTVTPAQAVVLKSAKVAKWPLEEKK